MTPYQTTIFLELMKRQNDLIEDQTAAIDDLMLEVRGLAASLVNRREIMNLEELARVRLAQAMARTKGNKTRAAALLGVTQRTVRDKVKAFDLAGLLESIEMTPAEAAVVSGRDEEFWDGMQTGQIPIDWAVVGGVIDGQKGAGQTATLN